MKNSSIILALWILLPSLQSYSCAAEKKLPANIFLIINGDTPECMPIIQSKYELKRHILYNWIKKNNITLLHPIALFHKQTHHLIQCLYQLMAEPQWQK